MELRINLPTNSYDIVIKKGALNDIDSLLNIKGKILLIMDDFIPVEYKNLFLINTNCKDTRKFLD